MSDMVEGAFDSMLPRFPISTKISDQLIHGFSISPFRNDYIYDSISPFDQLEKALNLPRVLDIPKSSI